MSDTVHQLKIPCSEEAIRSLEAGSVVSLSGRIVTGRDRLHKYLYEGGASPVSLDGGAIFHCGPVIVPDGDGWRVVAAGPTTSMREEPYMGRVIASGGIRVIIGKGGMGAATVAACAEYGCVYLQAVGGAAAVLARAVRRVAGVHFLDEFGAAEAMWEFDVEGLEAVVTIDSSGNSIYEEVERASREALQRLL